jgi:hypothetical protein
MHSNKLRRLRAAAWKVGNAEDFLQLTQMGELENTGLTTNCSNRNQRSGEHHGTRINQYISGRNAKNNP